MKTSTIHCPACDRPVQLGLTDSAAHHGQATIPDGGELVCLGFGRHCAGRRCALTGVPSVVMGVRLARAGLEPDEGWRTIRMLCEGCGATTRMKVLDNVTAYCPDCGSANRWFLRDAGETALTPPSDLPQA